MKKLIASLLIMTSSSVMAGETTGSFCTELSGFAKTVMESRQVGVPLSVVLEKIGKQGDLTMKIILSAYKKPRYTSESYQVKAVNEFETDWLVMCLESGGD